MNDHHNRLAGILLGTAVGDSLGLPAEGLSPRRRKRFLPGPWRQRLVFRGGMISDDTEHALFTAQSLLLASAHPMNRGRPTEGRKFRVKRPLTGSISMQTSIRAPSDAEFFQRRLAGHLRWWLASLPAGTGKATAKACLKLWLGFPPERSGVYSAGNGPAMRSAILGGYFFDRPEKIAEFVGASSRLTHTDPRANVGAQAVASIAAWAVAHDPSETPDVNAMLSNLREIAPDDAEWNARLRGIEEAFAKRMSATEFAVSQGLEKGVTGYIYHTVPVAVYAWLAHYGDFRGTLEAALDCGGDADTLGAIAGALAGATTGAKGIPEPWLDGLIDWPRSIGLLRRVARRLAEQKNCEKPLGEVPYFFPAVLPRNLFFLSIVLYHALRRLAPPY